MPIRKLLAACAPDTGPIHAYLHWAVETTHAPQLFHLGAILAAVSYEASRRGLVIDGSREPFRLLFCFVAGPGSAKSTAKNRARSFVREWYAQTTIVGDPPDPYVSLRGSLPGVLDLVTARQLPSGVTPFVLDHDELSLILRHEGVEEVLNELFDGADYERNLVRLQRDGKSGKITQPRVNGVFCSTVSTLETTVTNAQVEGGLFSRVLFLRQQIEPEDYRSQQVVWPEGYEYALNSWCAWRQLLDVLFAVRRIPQQVQISDAARQVFENELVPVARDNVVSETREAASMSRLVQHATVISACYALADVTPATELVVVGGEHARRAVKLVTFCGTATQQLAERLAVDPLQRFTARVEATIRAAGADGISRTALYKLLGMPPKAMLDQALLTLLDANRLQLQTVQTRGRPSVLHVHTQFVNGSVTTVH